MHPLAPLSFDKQIPKKGDQRQMEAWQRIGTYAAGLALDSAGIKGNTEILSRIDMIVAAGGGERDLAVDSAVLNSEAQGNSPPGALNERLMNDLRPTLFLAQLSNLLAGNIAIVHGVTGSSRTFMGEEEAGVDAARIALARIAAGQSDIALIGAAQNGERKDLLMLYEFGDFNLKDNYAPVLARGAEGRLRARLRRRVPGDRIQGACGGARRQAVRAADQRRRRHVAPAQRRATSPRRWSKLWAQLGPLHDDAAIITGATGAEPVTVGRSRVPARARRAIRCARPAPRSATSWKRSFRSASRSRRCRCRAARCFRRTIRPGSRLKCRGAGPDCGDRRRPLARRRHGAGRGHPLSSTDRARGTR